MLGATGQQGGAVAAALRAEGWAVRAVVRDPAGGRARALSAAGVEVVGGDLADPRSLRAAFSGAYGVFSVQPSAGQAGAGLTVEDEFRFGVRVAEIAEERGVAHLVYTSTIAAGATSTGVAHLDVKSRIEDRVRASGVASTIVRPVTFMELLMLPGMGLDRGRLTFLARPDQTMQFIAVRDIGRIVARVFAAPERYAGRTRGIAGDALTGRALGEALTRAAGRPIDYARLPDAVLEGDEVLGGTAALVDSGRLAGDVDLDALREEFPFLSRFDDWLEGPGADPLREAPR
ncbi:NmrA/HSCARG family protein [Streptomyces sedi]|uniref:NmrA/HSCARG family protein n=1 Tax=Streptomyces sedi TaxID=555059 RepID=UPI001FEACD5B|nr:NmrA/HSCARG family protein [Streptomyces sedi]